MGVNAVMGQNLGEIGSSSFNEIKRQSTWCQMEMQTWLNWQWHTFRYPLMLENPHRLLPLYDKKEVST